MTDREKALNWWVTLSRKDQDEYYQYYFGASAQKTWDEEVQYIWEHNNPDALKWFNAYKECNKQFIELAETSKIIKDQRDKLVKVLGDLIELCVQTTPYFSTVLVNAKMVYSKVLEHK